MGKKEGCFSWESRLNEVVNCCFRLGSQLISYEIFFYSGSCRFNTGVVSEAIGLLEEAMLVKGRKIYYCEKGSRDDWMNLEITRLNITYYIRWIWIIVSKISGSGWKKSFKVCTWRDICYKDVLVKQMFPDIFDRCWLGVLVKMVVMGWFGRSITFRIKSLRVPMIVAAPQVCILLPTEMQSEPLKIFLYYSSPSSKRRKLVHMDVCIHPYPQNVNLKRRQRLKPIHKIVEKLLIAAVADADVTVRHSIFSSLHGNAEFDDFLAQADSLTAIFSALNDEFTLLVGVETMRAKSISGCLGLAHYIYCYARSHARDSVYGFNHEKLEVNDRIRIKLSLKELDYYLAIQAILRLIWCGILSQPSCEDLEINVIWSLLRNISKFMDFEVREYAISLAGRLSEKNPAYVLPALRRHLIQLLTYLEHSPDSKCREESAKLLGCLIRNCERLIHPYIAPIHKALVAKLCEGTGVNANNGIISGVLVTVGDLARVGGFAMRQYISQLMPLIVEALLDGAAATKREVAVATLGQVVQSTGYVITPYNEYPPLLGLLLKLLNGELAWSTRREVMKVLGIMGALDPHMHKRNQLSLPGSYGEVTHAASDAGQHIRSMDEVPMELWPSFATSEDYYSTVAISSLMRILRDPSLSSYHQKVVGSLMFIFKSMGLGCVPYLPKVLPDLFHTVRTCEDGLKEFITWKLGTLVSIVRQHIRKYLPALLSLISELWSSFSFPAANRPVHGSPILHLVEQLCLALNDEFRTYLPDILPCCIQVLTDAERFNDYTYVLDILHTLEVFGGTLDEHMHLLLPALIRLFKVDASVDIRCAAIKTLTRLIPRVQVTGHISALVHHLKLVLDGFPAANRPVHGSPILHLVEQLCLALNDEFRTYLPDILPCCIQVLTDAERFNDYTYVLDILHTLEVFGGTLDEHMHLLLPALIRLFKVDASVDIRCAAIKTLTRLIPRVQVTGHISALVHHLKLVLDGKNDELRKDAVDALCCLAHALGEDFTIFIPSIRKLLLKYHLQHKEFEEIEGRSQRHEPLILASTTAQRLSRQLHVEVISDPLSDVENDDGIDVHRQFRNHQFSGVYMVSSNGHGFFKCNTSGNTPAYVFFTCDLELQGFREAQQQGDSSNCAIRAIVLPEDKNHAALVCQSLDYVGVVFARKVNDAKLRASCEASQRSTKEDWAEWMRHCSIELLKESPSPALRTCARLAQLQPFVGRELFAAGFVSCWSKLSEASQRHVVRSLEMAFSAPNITPEILATLLNLSMIFTFGGNYPPFKEQREVTLGPKSCLCYEVYHIESRTSMLDGGLVFFEDGVVSRY
ncbi:unnamed protein product [Ilex paraguariensis]|uniref:Serine/threonine-protein kinase TOR n=1 Tax=Ilex paraguariensis TaxID=185542 RepID=A0ABC8RSI1_9AQUA